MLSRWLCCAMPMTAWPTSDASIFVCASVARIASPPSCVAESVEKRPGDLLSTRMSARGSRRAPSRMTIDSVAMLVCSLLVQKRGRHARAVLDEVLHADIHVDGLLAAAKALGLDAQTDRKLLAQPALHDVDDDGIDRRRAMSDVHWRDRFGQRGGRL